jgi:TrwC relaxase
VIGFAQIAGGAPSSVGAMTRHLLNNTVSGEEARLAAYYGRGMVRDDLRELAGQVADGSVAYADALGILVQDYLAQGGNRNLLVAAEARLGKRLGDLVFRVREGLEDAPVAVIRSDLHPLAARGLGIDDPQGLLSPEQINALLAGRRTDGALIAGKSYARERRLPVDPKTGEQRYSGPIGSYDFCPTPDKSVSVAWAFAPPTERAKILYAHHEAAREVMAYIAAEIGKARVGKAGQDGAEPGHVAWLEFTHHTARRTAVTVRDGEIRIDRDRSSPGDPDLHTHFLVPNAVFCESGRVGSLDTAAIGGFIFEADAVYQALLGQKLRDAGFAVDLDHETGAARMPVIPDTIRTLFSKRSAAGEVLARKATADRE